VTEVVSDTEATTKDPLATFSGEAFVVTPKLDQAEVFDAVEDGLAAGRCVGIFPEGGSHDRTDFLPLKAGICIMALGAMAKYSIPVKI
jgi:glycerol-3-phosphate O-acyltransferase/dihydroxyacetone phosphate acyltransferase